MPFLAPLIPLIGAGAAIAGVTEGAQQTSDINKATNQNLDVQQQQMQENAKRFQEQQALYNQLFPFFQQYMQQGSPFLSQIQRAGAEQNAQQFNNAAGQLRNQMQTSGLGYGPSGTTAAALGGLGAQAAQQGSSTYLQNLLNNENLKFQAAQGLNATGQMVGTGPQSQVNPLQIGQNNPLASSLSALGQVLPNILGTGTGGVSGVPQAGQLPGSSTSVIFGVPQFPSTSPAGNPQAPATQGWG